MEIMKKTTILLGAALVLAACAKTGTVNSNVSHKEYLEAWLSLSWPGVAQNDGGIYVLEDEPGTGATVGTTGFVVVDYTSTELDGTVVNTTYPLVAKRTGDWKASDYYGPMVQSVEGTSLPAGIAALLDGMQVGGRRKALLPSWMMTTSRYATQAEYLAQTTDETSRIYDVTLVAYETDIDKYQFDQISARMKELYNAPDSTSYGLYYHQLKAPDKTGDFPADTTVYITYIGRRLDGTVFDTNIENIAKDAGLYSASKEYGPAAITWASSASELTMTAAGSSSSSTMISGFQKILWGMGAHEKGVGMFYSQLGYGTSGSGTSIPAYAPLSFEIELVDKQE